MSPENLIKLRIYPHQPSWTTESGFVAREDRAVCALCCENVVCLMYVRVQCNLETTVMKFPFHKSELTSVMDTVVRIVNLLLAHFPPV